MTTNKDQVAAVIVMARDNLEQALSELEQLHAVDPSIVAFTAHVMNNYLTITGGTIELLRSSLSAHPDTQIHTWLNGLEHVTTLMAHAVNRLMSASVTQATSLRFESVELPILVERVCDYYQRLADYKRIQIFFESNEKLPPVWADRVAVAAVLDNLLSNAVKYSPHDRRIWVNFAGNQNSVTCSVRDEGPGLSAEEQARLFQPGVRLSPKPTGGEPTTGYGLAVAKELIDQLGGAIWCESIPKQGACFSFRLPASQPSDRQTIPVTNDTQ